MDYVFCLMAGDCIECGCNLISIHDTQTGALTAAMHLIEEKESWWVDRPDYDNWRYVEDTSERNDYVLYYARIVKGYDIIMVTQEKVNS